MTPLVEAAATVAARSLRANLRDVTEPGGRRRLLVAGSHQFHSVWTRDFCFSVGGLLALGEGNAVRDTLDQILTRQRADGLFPRLLDSYHPLMRFVRALAGSRVPLKAPLAPNFVSDHFVIAYDSNALVAWASCRYALETRDLDWGSRALPALEKAMTFYDGRERGGLLYQPPFSDWKDTVAARRGAVFFTQLLRWQALRSLAGLCRRLGRLKECAAWAGRAKLLWRRAQRAYWDEGRGHFHDSPEFPLFSSEANLAAVAWGFAVDDQSARLLRALDRLGLATPWGPRAGERYPRSEKGLLARIARVHHYHDDCVWLWVSALALRAYHRAGKEALRDALLDGVCRLLVDSGEVSEVYDPSTGRPVATWLYRSETPFSWSAAMLLEAFRELESPPVSRPADGL